MAAPVGHTLDVAGGSVLAEFTVPAPARPDPPVVLVHGAGMDHTVWRAFAALMADGGWSVVAPDLPGHGRSEGPAHTTVTELADWIGALIPALGMDTAHIVGHSLGALGALEAAVRHPERVASLSMIAIGATMTVNPDLQTAADADDPAAARMIARWSHTRHGEQAAALVDTTRRLLEAASPGVIAADLRASHAYRRTLIAAGERLCPVLLVLGGDDRMVPSSTAIPLVDALGATAAVVIGGAGHMVMNDRPRHLAEAVTEFLEGTATRDHAG